jgi:hypothetical protein
VTSSFFGDKGTVPDDAGLRIVLGPAYARWASTLEALERTFEPLETGWSFAGKAHGWSLRCSQRGRPVVYLTPLDHAFRASLAIPERSMPAAREAELPPLIHEVVATAPAYPEGRAVRISIDADGDVAALVTLARIRMAR